MARSQAAAVLALVLAAVAVVVSLTRGASAEDKGARLVYLYVSGQGPQAKAWYDGGTPAGEPVQAVLDRFSGQGFRYVGMESSGTPAVMTSSGGAISQDVRPVADYVILLERR